MNLLKSILPTGLKASLKQRILSMLEIDRRSNLYDLGSHIAGLGFNPSTVIDVGAASGTLDLMSAFPKSKFLLIEPLSEHKDNLNGLRSAYDVDVVIGAASDRDGIITLNVHPHQLDGSSVLREEMGEHTDGCPRAPCFRVDNYFKSKGYSGDVFLKIDVQGAELSVMDGCRGILPDIQAVALEVSLLRFMKGGPIFDEVVNYMKSVGFVAYDIIHGWYRPLDNALGQVDILFVKENSFLRSDHRYEGR